MPRPCSCFSRSGDAAALESFHQHGATHFLVSPFTAAQLLHAIQFAHRHAERVGGPRAERRAGEDAESTSWRWQPGSRTVELSPALARQAGLGEEEGRRISLMELFRKLGPEGRRAAREAIDRLLATGEATAFAHGERWARIAHHVRRREGGEVVGRAEAIQAGGERRDPLTGLRDGRAARAWIAARLGGTAGTVTSNCPLVAILVSVSRYDAINAAFGRATGDAVLQAVARRIERQTGMNGRGPLVARMAGAEFAVLLPAPATVEEGGFLAGQLVEAIGRPFASGDHVITLGARAGVAAAQAGDEPAALLRRASAALAEAKAGEGAPVHVLAEGAESATARGDRLEVDLRRALDQEEIEIRFQPQVAVTGGAITGVEALARWNHPLYGELGAQTLFSVAEGSDYLAQLSDHVQRKAIQAAAAWPEALSSLRLSVNITAADIVRPGFAALFLQMARDSGFAPERLTVEVTESGLIEDLSAAAALLAELRERRPAGRDRRFRHRLFEPRLPQGAAARLSEDRQAPLPGHCRLDPRPDRGPERHRHGALARPRRHRRGGGDRGAIGPARRGGLHALPGLPLRAAADRRGAGAPGRGLNSAPGTGAAKSYKRNSVRAPYQSLASRKPGSKEHGRVPPAKPAPRVNFADHRSKSLRLLDRGFRRGTASASWSRTSPVASGRAQSVPSEARTTGTKAGLGAASGAVSPGAWL